MDGLESPWRVAACSVADPPPSHWREELAGLLGVRPRRLGTWAELGLYGARTCLEAAGLAVLPPQAMVCVASLSGSESATHATAAQCRDGLPLPFGFLQSQSSQLLAALGQWLQWEGEGGCLAHRDPAQAWRLAQREALQAQASGLLLGQVEESGMQLATRWWWLVRD